MEGLAEFLETVQRHGLAAGRLRGLFHLAIGRRVTKADGTAVSAGVTWRELSNLLKQLRFDREAVAEVGADPTDLPPRDRQRFWYSAIALAKPDSPEARAQADELAALLKPLGYVIGPPPAESGGRKPAAIKPAPPPPAEPEPKPKAKPKKGDASGPGKKKKK